MAQVIGFTFMSVLMGKQLAIFMLVITLYGAILNIFWPEEFKHQFVDAGIHMQTVYWWPAAAAMYYVANAVEWWLIGLVFGG